MDTPNYSGSGTWEEKSITAILKGDKFLADAKTVHNIIYSNIAEYSDTYTWIKPRLTDRNGRLEIVAFRGHFSGDVAYQVLVIQSTVNFDKLFSQKWAPNKFWSLCHQIYQHYQWQGESWNDHEWSIHCLWYMGKFSMLSSWSLKERFEGAVVAQPTRLEEYTW